MSVSDGVHKPISPNPTQPPNPERSSVTRLEVWLGGSQRDAFGYVHSHRDHDNHIMSRLSNLFLLLPEIFFLFVMKDQILSLLHIHFTKVFFLCYRLYYGLCTTDVWATCATTHEFYGKHLCRGYACIYAYIYKACMLQIRLTKTLGIDFHCTMKHQSNLSRQ